MAPSSALSTRHLAPGTRHLAPGTRHSAPGTQHSQKIFFISTPNFGCLAVPVILMGNTVPAPSFASSG